MYWAAVVVGSAGYVQAVPEMIRQWTRPSSTKYLVVGYGSTGSFAGLWAGAAVYNAPFRSHRLCSEPDYQL